MSSIFEFDVDEAFDGDRLDESCWLPHYRPYWSTWYLAAARCTLRAGQLHLLIEIEADQPPWCPNLDEALRVSSLQSALWAGEPGSTSRPHQFDPPAVLQSGAHYLQLFAPIDSRFEARLAASAEPRMDGCVLDDWGERHSGTIGRNLCLRDLRN